MESAPLLNTTRIPSEDILLPLLGASRDNIDNLPSESIQQEKLLFPWENILNTYRDAENDAVAQISSDTLLSELLKGSNFNPCIAYFNADVLTHVKHFRITSEVEGIEKIFKNSMHCFVLFVQFASTSTSVMQLSVLTASMPLNYQARGITQVTNDVCNPYRKRLVFLSSMTTLV